MDLALAGRAVVCTGAAGGIGRAVARQFAEEGARVLCVDRTTELAEGVASSLPGGGHAGFGCDMRDPGVGEKVVGAALDTLGGVEVLAHLAAVLVPSPVAELTAEDWDLHLEVNARASFLVARTAAEHMRTAGAGGRIILASSGAFLSGGMPGRLAYASSKGAVTTLARGLAREYGPDRITVNAVAPGFVDTAMMRTGLEPEQRTELENATPLRRFAEPDEVASCIVFLASSQASFVSGATLNLSGGSTLY